MRPWIASTALITTTCLGMAGCGESPSRSGAPDGSHDYAANGTFTMAISDDLGAFDPYRSRQLLGKAAFAYDSLLNQEPTGRFVSGLARRWSVDATTASFTLRPDVTCSDGTRLTAGQVAADIAYVSDPKNASPQYGVNTPTVPMKVTADDAGGTVKVVAKRPYGFLLNTIGLLPIVCADGMKNPKLLATGSDGTGPFVLSKVVPGQSYTFTVRKGYTWGPGGASTSAPGTPARVVLRVVPSQTTAANLLLTGELSLAKVTGQDRQRLVGHGFGQREWNVGGAWLSFNQRGDRPTVDKQVRQALVQALDLDQIVKVSTGGSGGVVSSLVTLIPNPCPGNSVSGRLPRRDLAAAQTALDAAGWKKGSDGIRRKGGKPLAVDLHYIASVSPYYRATAELLTQQWRGIGVQVKQAGDAVTTATEVLYKTSNWDVFLTGYNFSLPSQLVPYLSGPVPPAGANIAGLHNKDYDALAAKALTMTPPTACTYWNQAESAIVRDLDIAPISDVKESWFLRKAQARIQRYDTPTPTTIRVLN